MYRTRFVTTKSPSTAPVLVAGRQHSGNTMLSVLLGRMPGWYAQSEESTLLERHGIIDQIADVPARAEALVQAIGLEDPDHGPWLADYVKGRWIEDPSLPALTMWRDAMDGLCMLREDTRWAQKGTSYIFYAQEVFDAWPDCRMLFMLRNPWDLVASRRKRNPKMEAVLSTVLAWVKGVQLAEALERSHPDRFRIVQYEKVTAEGPDTIRSLCEWLDTPYDDAFLDVPHVNPSENPYVLESEGRQHGLNTSRIFQYRSRLKPHEVAATDMALARLGGMPLIHRHYPDLPHTPGSHSLGAKCRAAAGLSIAPLRYLWVYLTYLKRSPMHIVTRTWRRMRS